MTHSKHNLPPAKNQYRDDFFDDCFSFDIPNDFENRTWSKIDEFMGVPDLVKKGEYDKAWFILDHVSAQYTDYYFIYAWKATILQKQQDYHAARKILNTGLKKARSTHLLCERMGYLEFEFGDINDAVMWWIRSVVLMGQSNSKKRWEALLYLAYIAKTCGCVSNRKTLMAIVSQISIHGRLELEPETIALLEQKVPNLAEAPAIKALDHLCVYYLKDQIQSDTTRITKIGESGDPPDPIEIKPNLIALDKKAFYYLGGGILFVIFMFFSFYYFNSHEPKNRPLDTSNADMNSLGIQMPDQPKITRPDKSQTDKSQTDKSRPDKSQPDQSQGSRVNKTALIQEKMDSLTPKVTNIKSPELKKTTWLIDHKKRDPGLKLKTKFPKPVRIQKKKTED